MSTVKDEELWEAEALNDPTGTSPFLVEWARETAKASIPLANDCLRSLIVLNTALLGGGIYFLGKEVMPPTFRVFVVASFIASLCSSFAGIFPYRASVPLNCPERIAAYKSLVIGHKMLRLQIAAFFLVLGFALALIGVSLGNP